MKILPRHKHILVGLALHGQLVRFNGPNGSCYRWINPPPYSYGREIDVRAIRELVSHGYLMIKERRMGRGAFWAKYKTEVLLNGAIGKEQANTFTEVRVKLPLTPQDYQ